MKAINGGSADEGGDGEKSCGVGNDCTLVSITDGVTLTTPGKCAKGSIGTTITCYCSTSNGNGTELSSNGGMSRCWV